MVQILPQEPNLLYDAASSLAQGLLGGAQDQLKAQRQFAQASAFGRSLGLNEEDIEKLRGLSPEQFQFAGQTMAERQKSVNLANALRQQQMAAQAQMMQGQPQAQPQPFQVPYAIGQGPVDQTQAQSNMQTQALASMGQPNQANLLATLLEGGARVSDLPALAKFAQPQGTARGTQQAQLPKPYEQITKQDLSSFTPAQLKLYTDMGEARERVDALPKNIQARYEEIETQADSAVDTLNSLENASIMTDVDQVPEFVSWVNAKFGSEGWTSGLVNALTNNQWRQAYDSSTIPLLSDAKTYFGNRVLLSEFEAFMKKLPKPTNYAQANAMILKNLSVPPRLKLIEREAARETADWARELGEKNPTAIRSHFEKITQTASKDLFDQHRREIDAIGRGKVEPVKEGAVRVDFGGTTLDFPSKASLEEFKRDMKAQGINTPIKAMR